MKLAVLWRNLGDSVVYYPRLAKATGGVTAAIFFYQLFQRQSQLSNPNEWVRINFDEIEHETGLSQTEQKLARIQLIKHSLIKERLISGDDNTLEVWTDIEALERRLEDIWEELQSLPAAPTKGETVLQIEGSWTESQIIKTPQLLPGQRQPIATKVSPNYQFSGPWKSPEQFEDFQRALLEYFKKQGVPNPAGWVFRIIDGMTKGLVSPFWDEFVSGMALGESQKVKRDWELEPGVPYPAFEEERIQYYLHKGEPLEVAVAKARSDLRDPVLGKDLWSGFLRKCDRIADEAIRAKKLGVQTPYLPPSFTNRPEITKQSVMAKLTEVNPQFFLTSSNLESLSDPSLKQQEVSCTSLESVDIPTILSLQEVYDTPMGRTLVEKQIAEHPEWGYKLVDGKVMDSMPF